MNKNNKTLKEIFKSAVENYRKKDFKNAEIFCYKILSIDPNHFASLSMLSTISALNGNYENAKNFLKNAIKIEPNNTSAIHNLATAYKELGELKEATNFYKKVLEINPEHTNANYNLGLVFYKLKDLKKAKHYLKYTVEIQKNYALAFFSLGNIHVDLKEYHEAISCYQRAIEIKPDLVGAYNNLGLIFRGLNDFKNAISSYNKAIQIKPNHTGAHHNLAQAYKEIGEFEKAIESHKTAINHEPENLINYYFLSELEKNILDETLKSKVDKIIIDNTSNDRNLAYGNYLLAKYERKNKNYEKELSYLQKGHKKFYSSEKSKFDLAIKYCFEDVLEISEKATMENASEKNEKVIKPIFIVGVPRCGSTLIEKIIGSSKMLIPIGEETAVLENFINKKILEKKSLNLGSNIDNRNEISKIYKSKGLILDKYNFVFTDKSLNNFFYLKLIQKIYPNSKIINCKRDTLSSIMSIFQNNLTELAWTHDLENIFKYFNNYFNIIKTYKEDSPKNFYELKFENLVNNPEEETKKLMHFCELPWDKKCLEFYKRKDLISKTASNIQVREAIYKHSLNKYLPYKKLLDKYGNKYSWYK